MTRPDLLQARERTHGDFAKNAQVSQAIKEVFSSAGYEQLEPVYRECLDMIALKLSRIVSGRAGVRDHWADISGYALLAAEVCSE